ncbi:hypothetical protein FJZ19_00590 [Candidatus Pacearchaeota archaeon]|nr:hypothetical protein [Candidatus Pacearchaeota archaeon]
MPERTALDQIKGILEGNIYELKEGLDRYLDRYLLVGVNPKFSRDSHPLYPIQVVNLTCVSRVNHGFDDSATCPLQVANFVILESLIPISPRDLTPDEAQVLAFYKMRQKESQLAQTAPTQNPTQKEEGVYHDMIDDAGDYKHD